MAKALEISVNSISNFERNKTKIPAYIVKEYCDTCDKSADELLHTGKEFRMDYKTRAVVEELPGLSDKFLEILWELIRAHKGEM